MTRLILSFWSTEYKNEFWAFFEHSSSSLSSAESGASGNSFFSKGEYLDGVLGLVVVPRKEIRSQNYGLPGGSRSFISSSPFLSRLNSIKRLKTRVIMSQVLCHFSLAC